MYMWYSGCETSGLSYYSLLLLLIVRIQGMEDEVMSKESSVWDEGAFWRKLILPQEDKRTSWEGKGYRWFRSPNVIPIEQWRRRRNGDMERGQAQSPE